MFLVISRWAAHQFHKNLSSAVVSSVSYLSFISFSSAAYQSLSHECLIYSSLVSHPFHQLLIPSASISHAFPIHLSSNQLSSVSHWVDHHRCNTTTKAHVKRCDAMWFLLSLLLSTLTSQSMQSSGRILMGEGRSADCRWGTCTNHITVRKRLVRNWWAVDEKLMKETDDKMMRKLIIWCETNKLLTKKSGETLMINWCFFFFF